MCIVVCEDMFLINSNYTMIFLVGLHLSMNCGCGVQNHVIFKIFWTLEYYQMGVLHIKLVHAVVKVTKVDPRLVKALRTERK